MAKVFMGFRAGAAQAAAAATQYYPATNGGSGSALTNEALLQIRYAVAGTFSNLQWYVESNSLSGVATSRLRKNGANVNLSISVTAGTTGFFEDAINTDTISANDFMSISRVAPAGSGTSTWGSGGLTYNASTDNYLRCMNAYVSFALASSTVYLCISGGGGASSTESDAQATIRSSFTCQNFSVYSGANSRPNTTTFRTRKNGANGNMSVSVPSSTAGLFEDNTNTDSIANTDTYNYSITTGAGTATLSALVSVALINTSLKSTIINSNTVSGVAVNQNVTTNIAFGGTTIANTTEATRSFRTGGDFTLSNFMIIVSANTTNVTTSVRPRKASANINQVISVTSSATGLFEDNTNTDSIVATDKMNYQIAVPAGSGTITIKQFSILFTGATTAIKTFLGLADASTKTVEGLARASVKTWEGLA